MQYQDVRQPGVRAEQALGGQQGRGDRGAAEDRHEVLVAGLTDRFGSYGTIGLAVLDLTGPDTVLDLLLMSCRVMSRGVGAVLLGHLVRDTVTGGRRLLAPFIRTPVNQIPRPSRTPSRSSARTRPATRP